MTLQAAQQEEKCLTPDRQGSGPGPCPDGQPARASWGNLEPWTLCLWPRDDAGLWPRGAHTLATASPAQAQVRPQVRRLTWQGRLGVEGIPGAFTSTWGSPTARGAAPPTWRVETGCRRFLQVTQGQPQWERARVRVCRERASGAG